MITPNGEIHPLAARFPMLPIAELRELADHIKAVGLLDPLVLDDQGRLIDGRNRLAACQLAGVEPRYVTLNGTDAIDYIVGHNTKRRNLSRGQITMALVAGAEEENRSMRFSQTAFAEKLGLSIDAVNQATTILREAPDLVDQVINVPGQFVPAITEARKRRQAAKNEQSRLETLQDQASDLATLVAEERLTVREAWEAYQSRVEDLRRTRFETTDVFVTSLSKLWALLPSEGSPVIERWEPAANTLADVEPLSHLWTAAGIRIVADRLRLLADAVDEIGGMLP